jgi:hypothetical protein
LRASSRKRKKCRRGKEEALSLPFQGEKLGFPGASQFPDNVFRN